MLLVLDVCFEIVIISILSPPPQKKKKSNRSLLSCVAVLDFNIDGLVTGSSSIFVMGMTMEFCTLQAHHMVNTNGLILFWPR